MRLPPACAKARHGATRRNAFWLAIAAKGDLASPGKPLLLLESAGQKQIAVSIPANLATGLSLGDTLTITTAESGEPATAAAIVELAPAIDGQSHSLLAKLRPAENADGQAFLQAGQFVRVHVPGPVTEKLLVPSAAIRPFGQMRRVFVVKDGKAHLRLVKTGDISDGAGDGASGQPIEILSGLDAGDEVIVSGQERLSDGCPVTILP